MILEEGGDMDNREVIETTVTNMKGIYKDIGGIMHIIEENMENQGLKPFGMDAACTWEVSRSFKEPSFWLLTYFSRAYCQGDSSKKTVGFCIHIGGYSAADSKKLEQLSVKFPFVNVSLLEQKEDFKRKDAQERLEVWNWLWGAGWYEDNFTTRRKIKNNLVFEKYEDGARNITYFVDLLRLTKKETIQQLVIKPMVKFYDGEENWTAENKLPILLIAAPGID
jgi:hypothetical protein